MVKAIQAIQQRWSASSLVFVMIATSVCVVDVWGAITLGTPPALLRDLALMVFAFFYGNKSGGA